MVDERDAAALIIALAIGDTQRVSSEQWRVFNADGITHLVAISGLHVTLFCVLTSAAMSALWRRARFLQARWPRASRAACFGLAGAGADTVRRARRRAVPRSAGAARGRLLAVIPA